MPSRTRARSASVVTGRSIRPSAAALAENLASSKKPPALGKRKRATSASRSPSPARSDPGGEPKRARRSVSRTPTARASTAGPPGVSAAQARIVAALRARDDVVTPASHPRPSRLVFVWGNGDMGQFGLGTDVLGDIVRPRLHKGIEELSSDEKLGESGAGLETLASGGMHSLCIDERGYVWSWGINDNAALGRHTMNVPDPENLGSTIEAEILETAPALVQYLVNEDFRAVKIAAGDSVSVALGIKGELRVWGSFRSSDGLLGFDGHPNSPKTQIQPIAIPKLQQYEFTDIACGADHILALTKSGYVHTWGNGQQAQLGRKIIERRKTNGLEPERLSLRHIVAIGSGSYHSFAVDRKGIVYAWGLNSLDQTGVKRDEGGDSAIVPIPTEVTALRPSNLQGRRVTAISGGEHHTLFLLSDGSVWGCGRCDGYELGLADDHPALKEVDDRRIAGEQRWREKRAAVLAKREKDAAGKERAAARRRANSVSRSRAPTEEPDAQTQNGSTAIAQPGAFISNTPSYNAEDEWAVDKPPLQNEFVMQPVPIPFPPPPTSLDSEDDPELPAWTDEYYTKAPEDPVVQISVGTRHNLAVTRAGFVYAWGYSNQCALGLGKDVESAKTPTRVKSKAMKGWFVDQVSAGGQHCLALARRPEMPSTEV